MINSTRQITLLLSVTLILTAWSNHVGNGSIATAAAEPKSNGIAPLIIKLEINAADLNKYVYFDSSNGVVGEAPGASECENWTNKDKAVVQSLLEVTARKAPGLLIRAAANGPISIKKVAVLHVQSHGNDPSSGLACNQAGNIILADKFFRFKARAYVLSHELTHCADYGSPVALSKDWVSFANPIITKINKKKTGNSRTDSALNDSIFKRGIWPSLYGCEDYNEALAEYVATYLDANRFPIKDSFIKNTAPHLLEPNDSELEWSRQFRIGDRAFRDGNYTEAINALSAATQIDQSAALPYHYLAYCFSHEKELAQALDASNKGMKNFENAGITFDNSYCFNLGKLRSNLLIESMLYPEAIELLSKLHIAQPTNTEISDLANISLERIDRPSANVNMLMGKMLHVQEVHDRKTKRDGRSLHENQLRRFLHGNGKVLKGVDAVSPF